MTDYSTIVFRSEADKDDYEKYVKNKGVEFYLYVAKKLNTNDYERVSHAIRYDIRIKRRLYEYIGYIEEWLRGRIADEGLIKIDVLIDEEIYFKKLADYYIQYISHDPDERKILIDIKDLRNEMAHFKPLIFEKRANVTKIILDMYAFLPNALKGKFRNTINDCEKGLNLSNDIIIKVL